VNDRSRVLTSGALGIVLAAATVGSSVAAVQVVELSAQRVLPAMVVTLRIAMTAREAGTEPGALFIIPSGTFGDSPESLPCEVIGGAVEVGQIRWQDGTVEYEGASYAGVIGEATFTIPQLAVDTYRLAESIAARGTGCHIFTLIEVVAGLPDTAIPQADTTSGQAVPLGATVLAVSLLLLRELTGRAVSRSRH